jgi:outer membrane protein
MKRIYTILGAMLFVQVAFAQEAKQSTSFTLDQAIQYALDNSIAAKNATLDERIAVARVRETTGMGLPQVSASAAVQHNQKLQRFFTTYNPNGGFIDLSSVPGVQAGDVVAAQNFFQLKSSASAGISINQLIFNGSYFVGLQAANAYKEYAVKNTRVAKEQIVQNVTKAYYAVLINRERINLFNANIARLDSTYRNTKAMNENGFAESIDVDRIQVQLNNLVTERNNFLNTNIIVLEVLKFNMNYPMNESIDVSGTIKDIQIERSTDSYKEGWKYSNRADYIVLEANHRLQTLNLKNQYAGALPTLSAFANLGSATQSPNVGGLFKTNSSIKDEGGVGPDKWYGYSQFGVNLSWNLFTGLSRSYKIQQEKLALVKIDNGFKQLTSAIDLEIKQTSLLFENAIEILNSQKQNMDLASKIASVTKIKYEQGVGSSLEVTDAESSLRTAQTNYYSALFDAMVAKVDLDKAYGKLLPADNEKK